MTEVYWIGGIQAAVLEKMEPGEAGFSLFTRLLSEKGIRSNWLDKLHWCTDRGDNNLSNTMWAGRHEAPLPVFTWRQQQLLDHYLVASVSCEVLSGKSELAGIIQQHSGEVACSLLGSPRAVGRYNLIPKVRMILSESFMVDDPGWDNALRGIKKALEKAQLAFDKVGVMVFKDDVEISRDIRYPTGSMEIIRSGRGCIQLLNQMAGLILEVSQKYGLLISMSQNGSGLMTVVERT